MSKLSSFKICTVIVTYNRCDVLLRCIDAVLNQTYPCSRLLIVDNASTDKTVDGIKRRFNYSEAIINEKEIILGIENGVQIHLYRNTENLGGAGGFYTGLKLADETKGFDGFWMMDDDGYPSETCLEEQLSYLDRYDYIMPVSIDIENHKQLSWPTVTPEKRKTRSYKELQYAWGEVMNYVYPFNGSLLSKTLIDKVGYVDKRLFIWGDEYEHYWRCKMAGFNPITVIKARFFHPANKMAFVPIFFGKIKVPFVEQKWKMVCLARNYTYIYRHYGQWYKIPLKFFVYSWLFIVTRKGDFEGWKLYIASVIDGFKERFDRHKKYMH